MGKKSNKKKTIASTRKAIPSIQKPPQKHGKKPKKEGFFAKLFRRKEKTMAEKNAEAKALKHQEKLTRMKATAEKREQRRADKKLELANKKKELASVAEEERTAREAEAKLLEIAESKDQSTELLKSEHSAHKGETVSKTDELHQEKKLKLALTGVDQQKMRGVIFMMIGLFALIFIGSFLYNKIFRPQPLSELLPANATVGLLEVNVDFDSGQLQKFFQLFQKYPVYQKDALVQLLNFALPVDYKKDLVPWIGRKAGIALVTTPGADGQLQPLIFIEQKNTDQALAFLKSRSTGSTARPGSTTPASASAPGNEPASLVAEPYEGFNIYSSSVNPSFFFLFINNYLVIADRNKLLLQSLVDEHNRPTLKLENDQQFRKVANNLPQGGILFAYVNMNKFFDALAKNAAFASQKGRDFTALQPFLKIFSAEGLTAFADDDQLHFQQFTAVNREELNGATYLTYNEKYQGQLLELANETPLFFVGGHDLKKELSRLEEIFKAGTKTSSLIFEGLLEAQKQKYLGRDISLSEDLYPLLRGEYLVTVDGSLETPGLSVLLELKDKNNDLLRLEKVVKAFVNISGIFAPRIQEVTLPDGTKGQEVVASSEQITRSEQNYQGIPITTLKIGDLEWGIHYAILDNTFVLSSSNESLTRIIDRSAGRIAVNLKNSSFFGRVIQPVLRTADEVIHLKLGALTEMFQLGKNPVTGPYLLPFNSLTMTRNFFDDGISTIYAVDIL